MGTQPYGSQELAGSGTTDAQGKATSPTISLSNAIGDDTYALTVSWPGSSAYSASSATISYTPPNSPPPPPPAPAPDATAISGLVAQVSGGMISTPMITVTGTLTDTVSGKGVATQTLQVTENSDFDSGVATTGSNGTFSFVLQGARPGDDISDTGVLRRHICLSRLIGHDERDDPLFTASSAASRETSGDQPSGSDSGCGGSGYGVGSGDVLRCEGGREGGKKKKRR